MAAQVASDKYENARRNLKLVSDEARSTAKEIKSMSDAISKADNRAGSLKKVIGSKGSEDTGKSILSSLAGVGHCPNDRKLLDQRERQALFHPRSETEPELCSEPHYQASRRERLWEALQERKVQQLVQPQAQFPALFLAQLTTSPNKNEAYKSAVQEAYTTVTTQQAQDLENGIKLAGSREKTQMPSPP